jgi:hypothetical protein
MSSFVTPILAKFSAELEAAAEAVKQNILRELGGLASLASSSSKALPIKSDAPAQGQKRTPEALKLVVEEVFAVIQRHPGERIEQLAERAGLTTKEMALPIKKLRAAKRLTVAGSKRATRYTAKAAK